MKENKHIPDSSNIPIIHYPIHSKICCKKRKNSILYNHMQRRTSKISKTSNEIKLSEFHVCMYTYTQSIYCVSFSIDQPSGFHTKSPGPTEKIGFTAPHSYQPPQGKSAWGPLEMWQEVGRKNSSRTFIRTG